ncbi:MAG TPA: hypothetical protein VFS34_01365 [Thermoanaerobaculia bacterium]|nr:hypothetical protein [Thermoanaerobaculia bacterium]
MRPLIMLSPVIGFPLAGLACVLPGLALVRREEWARAEPVEIAAIGCAGSASWWAVGIWFLGTLGISLTAFAVGSLAAATLVLAVFRRDAIAAAIEAWRASTAAALGDLAFIAAVAGSRAIFALTRLACSVGDMSAHAYMAELVVMRNGLPSTYRPFLPIGDFGSFPPGFHALAAIETLLGGVPTYRSTIHVLCFSLAALTFSLVALLRGVGVGRAHSAFGAAGALMLARNPQFFEQAGRAPMLLAGAIVFLVLRDALRLGERSLSLGFLLRLALLSAGVLLVHPLPAASFLYVLPVALAFRIRRDRAAWIRGMRNGAIVLIAAGALAIPFSRRAPRSVPPAVAGWARGWFRDEVEPALRLQVPTWRAVGIRGGVGGRPGPQTWPFYVIVYLGVLPAALLALGLTAGLLRERSPAAPLAAALVGVHAVLFTGALTETLPLWPSLYPTRIGIWLAPALAIALAELGSRVPADFPGRTRLTCGVLWLALFGIEGLRLSSDRFGTAYYESARSGRASIAGILANEAAGGAFWIATFNRANAVLTPDDLEAFRWIRDRTPPGAVFATNTGDGGNLIPAIAHRAVLDPHFNLSFYYPRELAEWRRTPVDYIYVSSEPSPAHPRRYTPESLGRDPKVDLAFRSGEARVYEVKGR